jgi:hypothetical protein
MADMGAWLIAKWLHYKSPRRPLGFVLTPGEAHDVKGFAPSLEHKAPNNLRLVRKSDQHRTGFIHNESPNSDKTPHYLLSAM